MRKELIAVLLVLGFVMLSGLNGCETTSISSLLSDNNTGDNNFESIGSQIVTALKPYQPAEDFLYNQPDYRLITPTLAPYPIWWHRNITYSYFGDCSSYTRGNVVSAFNVVSNLSGDVLTFSNIGANSTNAGISFLCGDQVIRTRNKKVIILGEGGIAEAYTVGNFTVIVKGEVQLNTYNEDEKVIIHEVLHAMGFGHSDSPASIMYKSYVEGYTSNAPYQGIDADMANLYSEFTKINKTEIIDYNGRFLDYVTG